MPTSHKVIARLNRLKRGAPFSINDFYSLGSPNTVQKVFSRLVKDGVVERVSRGIYARPKTLDSLPSVTISASAEQVAKLWARQNQFKLTRQGMEAAYRLGLQTQAPMKTVYWTNGPTRTFKVGNREVEVRHQTTNRLLWPGRPEGELLRALLVTPPNAVKTQVLLTAFKRLSLQKGEILNVIRKLTRLPNLRSWRSKLNEIERIL